MFVSISGNKAVTCVTTAEVGFGPKKSSRASPVVVVVVVFVVVFVVVAVVDDFGTVVCFVVTLLFGFFADDDLDDLISIASNMSPIISSLSPAFLFGAVVVDSSSKGSNKFTFFVFVVFVAFGVELLEKEWLDS